MPQQQTMHRLDNMQLYKTGSSQTAINSINANLTIDRNYTSQDQLRQWAVLIDRSHDKRHFTKPLHSHTIETTQTTRPAMVPHLLTAVNGEQIIIYGIKQVTLVYQNLAIPTTFIISAGNCAILGLDAITKNGLQLRVDRYRGHLSGEHAVSAAEVQLHYIGNHFYLKATVFDGLYDYVDYTPDRAIRYYNWYDERDSNNKVTRSMDYYKTTLQDYLSTLTT
eukprot:6492171-Amphidinium_carterae.3